jgi:hypothetical protein
MSSLGNVGLFPLWDLLRISFHEEFNFYHKIKILAINFLIFNLEDAYKTFLK